MDDGLRRAFAYVQALLLGDGTRPGLSRSELERLVGYPERGEGPLEYVLPPAPALSGVRSVRFFYYPHDPQVQLIVEVEDLEGKRRHQNFRWNGSTWEPSGPEGKELKKAEGLFGLVRIGNDFFAGYTKEEAQALASAIREGKAVGAKYLFCPNDGTRVFYSPRASHRDLLCTTCGNSVLLYKTLNFGTPKDLLEEILEEQRALRKAIESLMAYLRRKLGP